MSTADGSPLGSHDAPGEAQFVSTDDWLEQRGGQVEAADDGVQVLHAGQALGVAADVDDSRVPAAGEHD